MKFENLNFCDTKMFRVGDEAYIALANPVQSEVGGTDQPWNAVNLATGTLVHFRRNATVVPIWSFRFDSSGHHTAS